MASHSIPPATNGSPKPDPEERPLTAEEGWSLFESLYGSMEGWFPEEGGPSEVLRREREAWSE